MSKISNAIAHLRTVLGNEKGEARIPNASSSWSSRQKILEAIISALEGLEEEVGSGSGSGSPLIVRCTVSNGEYVLSEDWDTINEAFTEDGRPVLIELLNPGTKSYSTCTYCLVTEVRSIENASEAKSDSGTGYVVVCTSLSNVDFNFKYIFYSDTSSGTLSCSETLPIGGGSGGGGAVAHATYEIDETTQEVASIVLDMTVDEIIAAEGNVSVVANLGSPEHPFIVVGRVVKISPDGITVIGIPTVDPEDYYYTALTVFADMDALRHPVWYATGGGGPK